MKKLELDSRISLRLKKSDKKSIEAQARRLNLSVSEYVRRLHESALLGHQAVESDLAAAYRVAESEEEARGYLEEAARDRKIAISGDFYFPSTASEKHESRPKLNPVSEPVSKPRPIRAKAQMSLVTNVLEGQMQLFRTGQDRSQGMNA